MVTPDSAHGPPQHAEVDGRRIDIFILDNHLLFRQGVRLLLERSGSRYHVTGEAAAESDALDELLAHPPDVVLIDLGTHNGIDRSHTIRQITTICPDSRVIAVATVDTRIEIVKAIRAGAHGYVTKSSSIDDVVRAIEAVYDGGSWIDPTIAPLVMSAYRKLTSPASTSAELSGELTTRDLEFLSLLAAGQNNKQISESTGLAESTVKNNLSSLFRKLGVRDRTQAVLLAIDEGLVDSIPQRRNQA